MMYEIIGATTAIAALSPFAAKGIKQFLYERKLKKAFKEGYVVVYIHRRNGAVDEIITKPNSNSIKVDKKRYILAESAREVDGGKYWELELAERGRKFDKRLKLYRWDFYEDEALPMVVKPEDPLLDPENIEKAIFDAALTAKSPLEKYIKFILIGIAALMGMVLLLGGKA